MATGNDPRVQRGQDVRLKAVGGKLTARPDFIHLAKGLDEWIDSSLWGDIWGRPGLDMKTRSIATIAALCVLGQEPELRTHVGNALNLGWKKEEIAEVFMQLVFYGGGPNSLNALKVASEVFEERGI